ncbi:MAG: hypothetical protein ABS904_00205 [Solibacillus isronensis]
MTNLNPYHGLGAKAESLTNGSALFVSDVITFLKEQNQSALRYSIIWALAERLSTDNLVKLHPNVAGLNTDYIQHEKSNEIEKYHAFKKTDRATTFAELLSDSLSELYSEDNERAVSLALETILYRHERIKQKDKVVAPLSFNLITIPDELQIGYNNFGNQLHYYYVLPTLIEKLNELGRAEHKVEVLIQFESAIYTLLTSLELLNDVLLGMKFDLKGEYGNDFLEHIEKLSENQVSYLNQMLFEVFCSNPIDDYTADLSLIQLLVSYDKGTTDIKGVFHLSCVGIDNFINSSIENNIMLNFDFKDAQEMNKYGELSFEQKLAFFIRNQVNGVHKFSFSFPMLDSSDFNIKGSLMLSEIKNMFTSPVYSQVLNNKIPTFYEFIIDLYRLRNALLTDAEYLTSVLERVYNLNHPITEWAVNPFSTSHMYELSESSVEEKFQKVRDSLKWRRNKIKEVAERITDLNNLMDYKIDALTDVCVEAGLPLPEDAIEATNTFMKRRVYYGLF